MTHSKLIKDGNYLLNPDYYAALLFSKTMKGNILKLKNSLNSTIHQYGTIRKDQNGHVNGLTLLILNYRNRTIFMEDNIAQQFSKIVKIIEIFSKF